MDDENDSEAGRTAAFRELADEHLTDAYRLAFAVLRDRNEAQDAVHDAFVTAWERWASLRDPAKFASWFKRIVINTCRNRLSKASQRQTIDISTRPGLVSPDSIDRIHDHEILAEAIAGLKPDDRIVLGLRYYRDMKIEDIAAVLGVPSGTATSRLHRAHQRLRTALEADGPKENRDE